MLPWWIQKAQRGHDNVIDVIPGYRKYDSRYTIISHIKTRVYKTCEGNAEYLCTT